MSEGRILLKNGTVVTLDPELGDISGGDVLINDGRIEQVGQEINAPDAEVVPADGMVIMPGLIDTHLHMWQHPMRGLGQDVWGFDDYSSRVFPLRERFGPQEMYEATYTCALDALNNGTTTALDFCHNVLTEEHAEGSLRAHRETGQRVLFAYGMLGREDRLVEERQSRLAHVARLHNELGSDKTNLVRLGLALTTLTFAPIEDVRVEADFGRSLGLPLTIHQNIHAEVFRLHEAGLLGSDLLPVHSNNITDAELRLLASCGCAISFTTESEHSGGLQMSPVGRADRAGVLPTLGVDAPSFTDPDMFAQLRATYNIMRATEAQFERQEGRWPLRRYEGSPYVTSRRVLEYATVNGAKAIGLGDELGTLTPGKQADIVMLGTGLTGLIAGDPTNYIVHYATSRDVDSVLVAGRFRKRGGRLVDVDLDKLAATAAGLRSKIIGDA
ncbi:Cytosine/adenosine deaminase [Sinosporangium album]|uniref:Cytosine/adenosine deaminase n=1 Tax=Sinosporangium album TaxID=504805 RepID=A0A1G8BZ03_9ACTN|nr:amidohydrolase family protein [Sinosporangium album]SDH38446.1 Cytosine/adenosine deaminase [Sinosporangium album]